MSAFEVVQALVGLGCLVGVLWLVVLLVRDRTPGRALLNLMAVVEVLLVVHLVLGVVRATTAAPAGLATWEYVGYLVGAVLLVPVGVVWSSGERTRGGTAVLLVTHDPAEAARLGDRIVLLREDGLGEWHPEPARPAAAARAHDAPAVLAMQAELMRRLMA